MVEPKDVEYASGSQPRRRILIIDDSAAVLLEAEQALRAAGHDVITTTETVGLARHLRSVYLVLIDYHMPGFKGAAVLDSLRAAAQKSGQTPLFYVFTLDAAIASQARQFGFDGAIASKGDPEALVRQVETVGRYETLRARLKKQAG
jgi:CheY-like chemotaxis protein